MATIEWAIGFNNQPTVLPLSPQPARTAPISHGTITYGGGARSFPQGMKKTTLTWNVMQRLSYPLVRTQIGLDADTTSVEGTVAFTDDDEVVTYYNAVAQYAEDARRPMSFWKDMEIELVNLEEVAAP